MQSGSVYKSYMFKLVLGFTLVALLLGFLTETVYREFFDAVMRLMSSEEHSYLLVSLFSVFTVIYMSLRYAGFSYGIRLSKILFSILMALLSLALYNLSSLDLEYRVQLLGLSFALLFITLILLIYELNSLSEVIPLLTPLLLTPLPAGFLDRLTPVISRYVGMLAGFLTGAKVVEAPGFTQLEVVSSSGEVARLSVEAACTGIVTASSIIAALPILLYMVTFSEDKPVKKIAVAIVATASALAIGLFGNLVRVLIVVYAAMRIGIEQAYMLFHYTPSIVYSALSTLAAFSIVKKSCRFKQAFSRIVAKPLPPEVTWGYVAGVFLFAILFTGIASLALMSVATEGMSNASSVVVEIESVSDYLSNPDKYLSTGSVVFTDRYYDSFLTRVLGALAVYRVNIRAGDSMFSGYVEVVDTTARLHTWQLCLTLQGYTVKSSWTEFINNTKLTYILLEKSAWKGVLAYTIIPTAVKADNNIFNLYTRISILASGNPNPQVEHLTKVLLSLAERYQVAKLSTGDNWLQNVFALGVILALAVFIAYVVVVLVWSSRFKVGRV